MKTNIKKHTQLFLMLPLLLLLLCAFHPFPAESGGIKKRVRKKLTPKITPDDLPPRSGPVIHDNYEKAKSHHPTKSSIVTGEQNAYQQCRATVMPSFINNSMSWGPKHYRPSGIRGKLSGKIDVGISASRGFKSLSPPSVIVSSAGNDYPKPIPELKIKAAQDYNMILVGSLSPSGHRSKFSQEGPAVTIMAPSDYYVTSATSTGQYNKFGGTSGAAPLVTGSLAGFEWLAGYHPTAEEAKILLAKTAIPTPYSNDKPRKNGVGMVNAYKLAMVGKQLKQICGNNPSCFKDLIRKNDVYNFPEDPALDDEITRAFPACSTTCTAEDLNSLSANCAKKAQVFKKLRKQAFLTPHNKELWKKIACIYSQAGLTRNADGALTTYRALSPHGKKSHQYCKTDADCALVPTCPYSSSGGGSSTSNNSSSKLISMNKTAAELHTITCIQKTKKLPLCNNKCRCSHKETIIETTPQQGKIGTTYRAICGANQCQLRVIGGFISPQFSPPTDGGSSPPALPPSGGGSVQ